MVVCEACDVAAEVVIVDWILDTSDFEIVIVDGTLVEARFVLFCGACDIDAEAVVDNVV